MSLSVVGVRDLDGQFAKMVALKLACEEAKVPYPQAVRDYFKACGCASESVAYLRQYMEEMSVAGAVEEEPGEDDTLLVHLSRLPAEVKALRVRYSY